MHVRKIQKIAGTALLVLVCFYILQYVATAIHFGCQDPKEDCPPPIYGAGELIYRVLVQPPWLSFKR